MAVEFALAIPILLMFFLGVIQYGGYFVLHQDMARAAREATRGLALGGLTEVQAITQVNQKLVGWSATFTVTATLPDPDNPLDTDVTVLVTVPYEDAALVGFFYTPQSGGLKALVTMRSEV